jgi:hypothetical protein
MCGCCLLEPVAWKRRGLAGVKLVISDAHDTPAE